MAPKLLPKLVPFLDPFLSNFWPQNGPQNGPKMGPAICNFGVHFWIRFFEALELFGRLLGAFLGFLKLSWEASGPEKPKTNYIFLRFLQMQEFWSLKLLMALLVPAWPLLGPIWSQNGPQSGPESGPKIVKKHGPTK